MTKNKKGQTEQVAFGSPAAWKLYRQITAAMTAGDITPHETYRIIVCLMIDLFNQWEAPDKTKERILRDAPSIAMSHVGEPPASLLH